MREAKELFYDKDFLNNVDQNPYLLASIIMLLILNRKHIAMVIQKIISLKQQISIIFQLINLPIKNMPLKMKFTNLLKSYFLIKI